MLVLDHTREAPPQNRELEFGIRRGTSRIRNNHPYGISIGPCSLRSSSQERLNTGQSN